MEEFLTVVKPARKVQSNIEKFESLSLSGAPRSRSGSQIKHKKVIVELDGHHDEDLNDKAEDIEITRAPVQKSLIQAVDQSDAGPLQAVQPVLPEFKNNSKHQKHDSAVFVQRSYLRNTNTSSLPGDACEILRAQPGIDDVRAVFQYLKYGIEGQHDFNIKVTGSQSAALLHVTATSIVPDLWPSLNSTESTNENLALRDLIVECFRSISGIEVVLGQVRELSRKQNAKQNMLICQDLLELLERVLHGPETLTSFLEDVPNLYQREIHRKLFWQNLTSLFAGSKILSTTAAVKQSHLDSSRSKAIEWLCDGPEYSLWLASNISHSCTHLPVSDKASWSCVGSILKRGLSLGHKDVLIKKLYTSLLLGSRALWTPFHQMLQTLLPHDQRAVFDAILHDVSRTYFNASTQAVEYDSDSGARQTVAGVAALVSGLVENNMALKEHIVEWVSTPHSVQSLSIGTRRGLVAFLAQSQNSLERILERSLTTFGDKVYIQHAPVAQQEHLAQTILLTLGYLARIDPMLLKQPHISSANMYAVSNRLSSSLPRVRLLGMVIGVGMSRCVDSPDKVMDFGVEEMESEDVAQLLKLLEANDKIGTLDDLKTIESPPGTRPSIASKQRAVAKTKSQIKGAAPQPAKIIAIEEVSSSSDDEDDLVPYQKPDDDPEDSDEDPTLLNRDKPSAPVYIIDLVKQILLDDKPDVNYLALSSAPNLIRRKANFGTELADNVTALVAALVNIREDTSKSDFTQLRLDSIIACLIAQPKTVSKYLTHIFFAGDFSINQRNILLTVIGLGSRELAGLEDHKPPTSPPTTPATPALAPSQSALTTLSRNLSHATIRPLALHAADTASGPDALKIRTFSSRLAVEKRVQERAAARTTRVPKDLYALLTHALYLPLCSPLAAAIAGISTGSVNAHNSLFMPGLIRTCLQTLTVLLNTLGPVGLSVATYLESVVRETLLLLHALSVLPRLGEDAVVLPAMLQLLLGVLDVVGEIGVSAQERLLTGFGREVAQLVYWANGLEGRVEVPIDEEGGLPWTVLAAGVAVKWYEMGKRFQGRMLGLGEDALL